MRDYIRIFRKRKFIVIVTFILSVLLFGFHSSRQITLYQSTTTVKYEERKTIAGLLTEWISYNPGDIMESQAKIIKGYPVIKKVALHLGFIEENSPLDAVNEAVTRISSQVETELIGRTNIIKIMATSKKPQEAVDLANAVARVYVEENLLSKNKQARSVREFVEEQLNSLKVRLSDTENRLKEYDDKIDNISIAEPIQEKIVDLEFQLAALLQKYTEKHPTVIQLKEQVVDLKNQIKGFSEEALEYARLKRETEDNRKLYSMLKEKLEQARITEAEEVSDVSVVNPAVMPPVAIGSQGKLSLVLGGIMGLILGSVLAFVTETLDTSIGTIEDVENITKLSVLGVVPSIEAGARAKGNILDRIKRRFFIPPKSEEEEKYIRLAVHYKPTAPISESFRNIRTNLKISPSKKVILITSSSPQEGKTTILTNLGLATAQEGLRTLLVSSDMRRPALAKTFGIEPRPGLSEVLSGLDNLKDALRNITDIILGDMEFDEAVKPSGLRNIWVLPCGTIPHNPAELLASSRFSSLLEQLRSEFDVVFFDSPPVLPVTDASLIANLVDSIVVCYETGRVSREALLRCKAQLDSVNTNISGIVLNHTRPQTEPIEPYPYYYRYKKYGYYTRDDESRSEK